MKATVIGGGVFGLTAAIELSQRGHSVELFEAQEIPAPRGTSGGLSKLLRHEYGKDTMFYGPGVSRGRDGWLGLELRSGRKIYHETGFVYFSSSFEEGSWAFESCRIVKSTGYPVEEIPIEDARKRFPAFNLDGIASCVLSGRAGWLDADEGLRALAEFAGDRGVVIRTGTRIPDLDAVQADAVVVAAGCWLAELLPGFKEKVRITRQHESYYSPKDLADFKDDALPAWAFDLETEGMYGAPANPAGIVKAARHIPGPEADPESHRDPEPAGREAVEAFVARRMPGLAGSLSGGRSCLYTNTPGGDFIFDEVPGRPGAFVVGGGNGHAFKFGLQLGLWGADLVEGKGVPDRFRWKN